ncbi:hypothetical protein HanIR_Chr06g0267071 [Helianthus annuus]|nr:hypothetical protein HanIR_Chr06g0267071 [Helianthus annuus]
MIRMHLVNVGRCTDSLRHDFGHVNLTKKIKAVTYQLHYCLLFLPMAFACDMFPCRLQYYFIQLLPTTSYVRNSQHENEIQTLSRTIGPIYITKVKESKVK